MLSRAPEPYTPMTLGIDQSMGVGHTVSMCYNDFLNTSVTEGVIEDHGVRRVVEPEVVAMLKAVLVAGCCRIEERAVACRKVFDACKSVDTKQQFVANLSTLGDDDPFVADIVHHIREVWRLWTC